MKCTNFWLKMSNFVIIILILMLFTGCDEVESDYFSNDSIQNKTLQQQFSLDTMANGFDTYIIGAGIHDITGPAAEVGMMGFAEVNQKTSGIHMRLRSRSFIIGDGYKRVVFVSADLGMLFQSVKQKVTKKVISDPELAPFYDDTNICLSAIHSHSGPGGYSHYFLYNATTLGHIKQNFDAIVDGIYHSIKKAHQNLRPGKIFINKGDLTTCSFNRSIEAYKLNPEEERNKYNSEFNTTMTLLKFVDLDGNEIGMVNWFALHPTTLGSTNKYISGDHKGLSSYLFEQDKGVDYHGEEHFVAAFAQTNSGDVSPNLWGPADGNHDYERMNLIARQQYEKAVELYNNAITPVTGPVDFRHHYVDMSAISIDNGVTTCKAAMGASFSAGSSEDSKPPYDLFAEGVTVDSISWNEDTKKAVLAKLLPGLEGILWPSSLSEEYKKCHAEKPILIPTGIATFDGNPFTPSIVPLQLLRIGDFMIIAQPSETTTMAGRRIEEVVLNKVKKSGVKNCVIGGLSNTYTSYVTTREEYASQQYEGASTLFGPNTLDAYLLEYDKLADAIVNGYDVDMGILPPDLPGLQVSFQTDVVFDDKPGNMEYGDIRIKPKSAYYPGETVSVSFWGGHPKNNLKIQDTYLTVEKLEQISETECHFEKNGCDKIEVCENVAKDNWVIVARDWDPETLYIWKRNKVAYSNIEIRWDTSSAETGTYRIKHCGHEKSGWTGKISPYCGVSPSFIIKTN